MTLTIKLPPRAKPLEIQLQQVDRIIDKMLDRGNHYKPRLYERLVARRNVIWNAWMDEKESPERCEQSIMANTEGYCRYV